MPIYEYKCSQCGKEFEFLVSRSQETIICPDCGFDRCDKWLSSFRSLKAGSSDHGSYSSSSSGCGSCAASSCAGCASH
ncbi:MAG: zinc ribbon domain-containing protein [Deltaproteobacteria bacterium]|nr:zinc ribbon domain-containing protein [Deltaproteobacteria bacterium]